MSAAESIEPVGFTEYTSVVSETREEFPDFRIVSKSKSRLMKVIDIFLKVITFWQMKTFMTKATTTMGHTVYTSSEWGSRSLLIRASVIRHERVHMRQRRRYGAIVYAIIYLFWPLPCLLAMGRRDLEREAYQETIRAWAEYFGLEKLQRPEVRDFFVGQFTSATYFWMWPFRKSMERWYDEFLQKVEHSQASNG